MKAYFEYLREMLKLFFHDLGTFFKETFADPWSHVPGNFKGYNSTLNAYKGDFGAGGWIFFIIFAIFFVALLAAIGFGLYLLIRKYVRFVKKELDKEALTLQVERLEYELYQTIQEKDKILGLKLQTMSGSGGEPKLNKEEEDTIAEVTSRFPKLTYVDNQYKDVDMTIQPVDGMSLEELCNTFRHFAASQLHLYYKIDTIRQLFAGLATSKLIILEGISGTGKTSLAYALGKFFINDSSICPVQPSWKDRSELIGYYNEFTKKFNETEFLKALYTTLYRQDMNIIVLDEMNLARIEYYFAEFLSIMEMPNKNEWFIELINSYDKTDPKKVHEGKIIIPQNAFFFGTANNDDSTFTISDKVYDRAISLFFDDKGIPFEAEETQALKIPYSQIEQMFVDAHEQYPVSERILERFDTLDAFVIKNFKLAFGNRILKQLKTFIPVYVACGGSELDGLDFIFTNKILKKFESLNIAFLKDELNKLNEQLDKLFGKGSFRMAHNYINNLIKMN